MKIINGNEEGLAGVVFHVEFLKTRIKIYIVHRPAWNKDIDAVLTVNGWTDEFPENMETWTMEPTATLTYKKGMDIARLVRELVYVYSGD
jgi:hypothetical protein